MPFFSTPPLYPHCAAHGNHQIPTQISTANPKPQTPSLPPSAIPSSICMTRQSPACPPAYLLRIHPSSSADRQPQTANHMSIIHRKPQIASPKPPPHVLPILYPSHPAEQCRRSAVQCNADAVSCPAQPESLTFHNLKQISPNLKPTPQVRSHETRNARLRLCPFGLPLPRYS